MASSSRPPWLWILRCTVAVHPFSPRPQGLSALLQIQRTSMLTEGEGGETPAPPKGVPLAQRTRSPDDQPVHCSSGDQHPEAGHRDRLQPEINLKRRRSFKQPASHNTVRYAGTRGRITTTPLSTSYDANANLPNIPPPWVWTPVFFVKSTI